MRERTLTLATIVTLTRLAFLPLLWQWALEGRVAWVGVGVMASLLGDILDGQLARRLGQVTRLGSQLDSVADALVVISSLVWLFWFRPEIVRPPYVGVTALGLGTWLVIIAISVLRFRRFLNLHLYTGKASGVMGAIFVCHAFVFGFSASLFYLAFGVFILGNLEALLVLVTRSRIDEHVGSILRKPALPPLGEVTR